MEMSILGTAWTQCPITCKAEYTPVCSLSPTKGYNTFANLCTMNMNNRCYKGVIIRGDSHARHIAGLVSDLTAPGTSVDGVCLPGAKLLDVLNSDQTSPRPGTRCEVLIAGTNDLAVGKQQNIYRHLETYITSRSKDTVHTVTI
ncbi:hypothetical protein J6590_002144 [Homalodisca vitripennis]|nr:hypothetical protein J6590_002144 [Homalodisca vitripennis]